MFPRGSLGLRELSKFTFCTQPHTCNSFPTISKKITNIKNMDINHIILVLGAAMIGIMLLRMQFLDMIFALIVMCLKATKIRGRSNGGVARCTATLILQSVFYLAISYH